MSEVKGDIQIRRNLSTRSLRIENDLFTVSNSILSLTNFSSSQITFSGSLAGQVVNLGDATSYAAGHLFQFYNGSTTNITIEDDGNNTLVDLFPYQKIILKLDDNSTSDGIWSFTFENSLQQTFGQTTDATPLAVQVLTLPTETGVLLETQVIAKWTGGAAGADGDGAAFVRTAHLSNVAGTVNILRAQTDFTSTTLDGMTVTYSTSGSDVSVLVTGPANSNIDWQVSTRVKLF